MLQCRTMGSATCPLFWRTSQQNPLCLSQGPTPSLVLLLERCLLEDGGASGKKAGPREAGGREEHFTISWGQLGIFPTASAKASRDPALPLAVDLVRGASSFTGQGVAGTSADRVPGHSASLPCPSLSGAPASSCGPQSSCRSRGALRSLPRCVGSALAVGGSIHTGSAHTLSWTCFCPSFLLQVAMGTAALGLLWAVLLLPLVVFGVPTEEPTSGEAVASSPPGHCRRCCDSEDALAPADAADLSSASPSALPYVLPEVRPYINITILKGERPPQLGWTGLVRDREGTRVSARGGEVEGARESRTEDCPGPLLPFTHLLSTYCMPGLF